MSRLAQAVARGVEELRTRSKKKERPMTTENDGAGQHDPADIDVAPEPETSQVGTEEEGAPMTAKPTTKRVRKSAKKTAAKPKAKTAKAAKAPPKPKFDKMPPLGTLKLADVSSDKRNRYINLAFDNGYVLRLFPVGFPVAQVQNASDAVIEWLKKRLK